MAKSLGDFDVVIVGAGMAGASLAFELADELRVLVLEQESQPGYHTTGRSAALFSEVYGNEPVRSLSRASRAFFDAPGTGFSDHSLLAPRSASLRWLEGDESRRCLPALRPQAAQAGLFEPGACDIDVHALHQGYLSGARRRGATVICNAEVEHAERTQCKWDLRSRAGDCSATVLVNAAGAWADRLAVLAGAPILDIAPLRRTALVFEDQQTWDSRHWPLTVDIEETIYFKPDAGRLLASPADQTPSSPCDAQPDEFDVAVLLDRLERLTFFQPKRITGRWAGLRTFTTDKTPVAGFDAGVPGFFWLAGQGGYGIQTAPALAIFSAALILGRQMPESLLVQGASAQALSPQRFIQTSALDN